MPISSFSCSLKYSFCAYLGPEDCIILLPPASPPLLLSSPSCCPAGSELTTRWQQELGSVWPRSIIAST